MSLVGLVFLGGLVVNHTVVLLDRAEHLRNDGVPEDEAIRTAAADRYRPVIMTTMKWGDLYLAEAGKPRLILHRDCGGEIDQRLHCSRCAAELGPTDVYVEPGPAAVKSDAA